MIEFAFPYALLLLPAPWLVWRFFPPYRQNVASLRFPFFRRITDAAGSEPRPGSVIVARGPLQMGTAIAIWVIPVCSAARVTRSSRQSTTAAWNASALGG